MRYPIGGSRWDSERRGLTLDPAITEKILLGSATATACPEPRTVRYPEQDLPADDPDFRGPQYTATCEGTPERNGFYGAGVVNAARAVGGGRH